MEKLVTDIQDAFILKPKIYKDDRGFFLESWNKQMFSSIGLNLDFIQDNHSRSTKHVLRGLHFQIGSSAQGKLVWVVSGSVFDVIVDLRKKSPTFGKWAGFTLTSENHDRLWVPPGCAHGFLVLSDVVDFCYKVTAPYEPTLDRTLIWNDETINVEWPLTIEPIISLKDSSGATFNLCEKYC